MGLVRWFSLWDFKGMCAKAIKPLTSFQPASLLLLWDPIFSIKCMMYDVLFSLPIPAAHVCS